MKRGIQFFKSFEFANTVAVEVQAHSENGKVSWLADFFTIDNGLIQQLHVYYGPEFEDSHEQG